METQSPRPAVASKSAPGKPIVIATRGSLLALAQANQVLGMCRAAFPARTFELRVIKTTGDRLQRASLADPSSKLPKGLFTKELEVALLAGDADFAVHSLKDLPTDLPEGLRLAAVLEREDTRDLLIARAGEFVPARPAKAASRLAHLPAGALIATSSTRRVAQLREHRPDLRFVEIRGNVQTRMRKLGADPSLAGTILAAAGLKRLGIKRRADGSLEVPSDGKSGAPIPPMQGWPMELEFMLPAVGQAAIGLEGRSGDKITAAILKKLNHAPTLTCVRLERAFLSGFGGGCHSPVAALATLAGDVVRFRAVAYEGERVWRRAVQLPLPGAVAAARRMGREARKALA